MADSKYLWDKDTSVRTIAIKLIKLFPGEQLHLLYSQLLMESRFNPKAKDIQSCLQVFKSIAVQSGTDAADNTTTLSATTQLVLDLHSLDVIDWLTDQVQRLLEGCIILNMKGK